MKNQTFTKKTKFWKAKMFKVWKLTVKYYAYLILPSLDNIKPCKKQREKSTANGHILTQ